MLCRHFGTRFAFVLFLQLNKTCVIAIYENEELEKNYSVINSISTVLSSGFIPVFLIEFVILFLYSSDISLMLPDLTSTKIEFSLTVMSQDSAPKASDIDLLTASSLIA